MELSFARCESIVKTLPIGFYTGRRIEISLEKEEATSFYDPMEDKIIISYPIIAHRMKNVTDTANCSEEEAVRSMLYHEVSHAILTPANELHNSFQLNCFEDERIETVLRNYYHEVDFRKQLYDVHGGHVPQAVDNKGAFFNAVRFGLGTAKVQKEVKRILHEYAELNRASTRWYSHPCAGEYENDVDILWDMIRKEFKSHPEEFQPQEGNGEGQPQTMDNFGNGQPQNMDNVGNGQNQPGQNQPGQNKNKQTASNNGDSEGKESTDMEEVANANKQSKQNIPYKGEPHESPLTKEQITKMVGASLGGHPNLDEAQVQKLEEFRKKVEIIIGNFNKKNKGGSGINAYSGVFNPRAVARKDYRFFERSMTTQGNNKFGTCHLNLIIDSSGSFCHNVPLTNGILAVLSEIERKNRNFSMDVGFINHSFRLCETVRDRKMVADGGNAIPDNMKEILMKLQKPQTCNYNIILFDGDAICQGHYGKNLNQVFGVFDMKQTTLITDPDNEQYMNPPFTSTKVVITQNYTDELIDHIIHALTIAFG